MELRHLRYFAAVAEAGHFTRAAERLGMQQPPLSQQIKALEEELGFNLFSRHPKGAELTAAGVVFLQEAKAILASVEVAAGRASRAAQGLEGVVAIGLTSSCAAHPYIPELIRRYRAAYPGVALEFNEGNAAELTEAVAKEKIHLAFLREPVERLPKVAFHRLLEEEMLLVLPRGHRLLARQKSGLTSRPMPLIPLRALAGEAFILVRRHGAPGMYSNLLQACERAGFTPRIALEVERMLTNISLVAAGVGISAVPASMQDFHHDSVVYCRIGGAKPALVAPITLLHREHEAGPAARNFLKLVRAGGVDG